jgi:hypothetical protein
MTEPCCERPAGAVRACPDCGNAGKRVERITVKALLRPAALARLDEGEQRFCASPDCSIVYFGSSERFHLEEVSVPVFQKEPRGNRTVCYCFAIAEGHIDQDIAASGSATAVARISALVQADRCACEVKNPQGSCCLGNVAGVVRAARAGTGQSVGGTA